MPMVVTIALHSSFVNSSLIIVFVYEKVHVCCVIGFFIYLIGRMRGKYHIYTWNWISRRCKFDTIITIPWVSLAMH
jgi:hypothetical protein